MTFPVNHLETTQLSCVRGGRRVLSDVNLSVKAGESLFLRGPNGSGKSTLLRLLSGLVEPENGTILWNGNKVELDPAAFLHQVLHIGHLDAVKPALSVRENLSFWQNMLGIGNEKSLQLALEHFNLVDIAEVPGQILSAGQKKRLSLARLIAISRPLWLLDEPSVSLDAASTEMLAELIRGQCYDGGMVIAATHLEMGLEESRQLHLSRTNTPVIHEGEL